MLSGLLSDVGNKSSARCASLFFPKTRPPAQGVGNHVSRSWGLASLMHALKNQIGVQKERTSEGPACSAKEASTRGRRRPRQGTASKQGRAPILGANIEMLRLTGRQKNRLGGHILEVERKFSRICRPSGCSSSNSSG